MAKLTKLKGFLAVFLLCVLVLSYQAPEVHAEFSPEVNQLLEFFQEVIRIDVSECTVSASHDDGNNSPELGIRGEKQGKISLHFNEGGTVDSLFTFRGEYLEWCLIYYDTGNTNPIPYLEEPSDDLFELTLNFMERYEEFTQDPLIGEMRELLKSKGDLQPGSKTDGNLKLTVSDREVPDCDWSYTIENEDYKLLSVGFFDPPHIFSFGDSRWRFNLDSSVFPNYEPLVPNDTLESNTSTPLFESTASGDFAQTENDFAVNSAFTNILIMLVMLTIPALTVAALIKRKQSKVSSYTPIAFVGSKCSSRKGRKLSKKIALTLILVLMLQFTISIQSINVVEANFMFPPLEVISIESDGSITSDSSSLKQAGNVYRFRGDITNYVINVKCDNIIIDGAGYALQKTRAAYGSQNGVALTSRTNVTIRNLEIRGYINGVFISESTNCNVSGNRFVNNGYGVVLADHSTSNYVSGNKFTSGGVSIRYSTDNVLRDNSMEGNGPHFSIACENVESASDYVNDVDASNAIEGKEICYWVNQHNRTVPSTASYVALINCSGITAENLNLTDNGEGVLLISTSNSQIANNTVVGNNRGLVLYLSENNSFVSNNIINSTYGILSYSTRNSFKNNCLENNTYDVNFEDRFIDEFDYSNIVDGAPICYWNWKSDKVVPTNVGYVVLMSCSNITIQNLNISHRRQGMLLVGLTDSVITNNIVVNNDEGIILKGSSNNWIEANLVENNSKAVYLEASHSNNLSGNRIAYTADSAVHFDDSNNNTISNNYIAHSGKGFILNRGSNNVVTGNSIIYSKANAFHIGESTSNTLTGNNIAWSRSWAISISGEVGDNKIHHNDFVNNMGGIFQTYPGSKTRNSWDDGNEGNFWSNYQRLYPMAEEVEGSNIMDTPLAMNEINVDRYPLVKPVDLTYQVTLLRPENKSYESNTLPVVFFSTATEGWMGYSLDSQQNVTVQGEAVLENLTEGTHRLTVYAGQNESGACASETVYFTITTEATETEPETTEPEPIEPAPIATEPAEPETTEPEPTENTETSQPSTEMAPNTEGTEPEPTNPEEPTQTEEPAEPEEPTEAPLITTEIAITIAVVAVAAIGIVAYWALRKRK
jgi:parallel beta-helix repeat protein